MVVFTPMPMASDPITTAASPGIRRIARHAWRTSRPICTSTFMTLVSMPQSTLARAGQCQKEIRILNHGGHGAHGGLLVRLSSVRSVSSVVRLLLPEMQNHPMLRTDAPPSPEPGHQNPAMINLYLLTSSTRRLAPTAFVRMGGVRPAARIAGVYAATA